MIAHYLTALTDALRFDRRLACAVRQEVEDHLYETLAADPQPDRAAAERQAVARFGEPQRIAAEFAVIALARRTRRDCAAVIVAVAAALLAMKARIAWYALQQWSIQEHWRALANAVLQIDRFAYWLAVILGIGAFALILVGPGRQKRLRGAFLCSAAAIGALVVTVISDGVLTTLQLDMTLRAGSLPPLAAMALEIAAAGTSVFLILDTRRRAALAAGLLRS
jgi:hypothetical protein